MDSTGMNGVVKTSQRTVTPIDKEDRSSSYENTVEPKSDVTPMDMDEQSIHCSTKDVDKPASSSTDVDMNNCVNMNNSIWLHYDLDEWCGKRTGRCRHCISTIVFGQNSTCNLKRHLKRIHPDVWATTKWAKRPGDRPSDPASEVKDKIAASPLDKSENSFLSDDNSVSNSGDTNSCENETQCGSEQPVSSQSSERITAGDDSNLTVLTVEDSDKNDTIQLKNWYPDSTCSYCRDVLTTRLLAKRHMMERHLNRLLFKCANCYFRSRRRKNMAKHADKYHGAKDSAELELKIKNYCKRPSRRDSKYRDAPRMIKCRFCFYETTKSSMRPHIGTVHRISFKPHFCVYCDFTTDKLTQLSFHVSAAHDDLKKYSCTHCSYKAVRSNYLVRHLKISHNSKITKGEIVLPDGDDFKEVVPTVSSQGKFPCAECSFVARNEYILERHSFSSHYANEVPIKNVNIFEKHYSVSTTAVKKETSQTPATDIIPVELSLPRPSTDPAPVKIEEKGPKRYRCIICGFSTLYESLYNEHMACVHSRNNESEFFCQHCNYTSPHLYKLKRHMKSIHPLQYAQLAGKETDSDIKCKTEVKAETNDMLDVPVNKQPFTSIKPIESSVPIKIATSPEAFEKVQLKSSSPTVVSIATDNPVVKQEPPDCKTISQSKDIATDQTKPQVTSSVKIPVLLKYPLTQQPVNTIAKEKQAILNMDQPITFVKALSSDKFLLKQENSLSQHILVKTIASDRNISSIDNPILLFNPASNLLFKPDNSLLSQRLLSQLPIKAMSGANTTPVAKATPIAKVTPIAEATPKVFTCDYCKDEFPMKVRLRRHVERTHDSDRPYNCKICDYKTAEKPLLDKHMILHM